MGDVPGAELLVDLTSFAPAPDQDRLAAIGRAFDADPRLRPERMDTRDPVRQQVSGAERFLADVPDGGRVRHVGFLRRASPAYSGDLETGPNPLKADLPRRLTLGTADFAWLDDPDQVVAFGELVVHLADAVDAAYGFATHSRMPGQQRVELLRGPERGLPAVRPPTAYTDQFALRDVYWLNVFGPAFVERFGDRLDSLGVRRDRLSNGGLVVWATPTPFVYDESLSYLDYPWKQPFYQALGREAFVHPLMGSGGVVPGPDDHRRLAGRTPPPAGAGAPGTRPATDGAEVEATGGPREPAPAWLVATVRDLRALGFFADLTRDDARMAADLAADHAAEWGSPPEPGADLIELELARQDADRVWWEDTEADVAPGNDAYVELIEGLARISRGGLAPTAVTEAWEGDGGPVRIGIELPRGAVEITPRYLDDYFDIETVLAHLNDALPVDAPRFALYSPFDQTAFVTCVTDPERRRLEERGWSFGALPSSG
jgi:hypothetical protein